MKTYVKLFESWQKEEVFVMKKAGAVITVTATNGKIERIDKPKEVTFPFTEGQLVTVFLKGWACKNGWTWNGESACTQGKKVTLFGMDSKSRIDKLRSRS